MEVFQYSFTTFTTTEWITGSWQQHIIVLKIVFPWLAKWKGQMRTWRATVRTTVISHITPSLLSILTLVCRAEVTSDPLCETPTVRQWRTGWCGVGSLTPKGFHCREWGNTSWDGECPGKCLALQHCVELWPPPAYWGEEGSFVMSP